MSIFTLIFFLELLHLIVMEHFPSIFKYSDSIFQFMIFMGGETQPQLACQEKIVWGLFYINFPQSSFAVVYKYHGQLHQGDTTMSSTKFVYATRKLGRTRDHYNFYVILFCSSLHVRFYLHFLCYSFY